jgi:hypothetical protein
MSNPQQRARLTGTADSVFERFGTLWRPRWAVAPGEHVNAGRFVWEHERLAVWCERRWFETVVTERGEHKEARATYRAAIDRVPIGGTWPTAIAAMDAVMQVAARRRAVA